MPGVLIITGCDMFDTSFTLEAPGFPEITWNVTRLEHDAFKGRFGAPIEQRFDKLEGYGPDYDEWQHLDRAKVTLFTRNSTSTSPVIKPDWRTGGATTETYNLIDIPGITVALPRDGGGYNGIPVDGNHRMKAREILGYPTFSRFIVPPELEGKYRIMFTEI
jgi:hypothetical protein